MSTSGEKKRRINRTQFFLWSAIICTAFFIGLIVFGADTSYFSGSLGMGLVALAMDKEWGGFLLVCLFFGANMSPILPRLHDTNHGSWVCLVSMLIPGGFIVLALYLLFAKGTQGANRYGEPPVLRWPGVQSLADTVVLEGSDEFYQKAYEELENGQVDKALWAKLFAQADGDENKAKAQYIKSRVQALTVQQEKRTVQEEKERQKEREKKAQELKKKANVELIEKAKGYLTLPVESGWPGAMEASPETKFIFKDGVSCNTAARNLVIALGVNTIRDLDVGSCCIDAGDMKTPAKYVSLAKDGW